MTYNRKLQSNKFEQIQKIIAEKVTGKIVPQHDEHGHHYKFVETGTVVDSVTTINGWIAKHHLAYWAAGCAIEWLEQHDRIARLQGPEREQIIKGAKAAHTDIRDDAGFVGTQAHDCIERYLKAWLKTGVRPSDIRLFFPTEEGDSVFGFYVPDIGKSIVLTDARAVASARAAEALMIKEEIIPVATEILVGDEHYSAGTLDFMCLHKGKLVIWDWKTSNNVDEYGYPLQVGAYKGFFEKMTRLKVQGLVIMKLSKDSASFEAYDVPDLKEAYECFKLLSKFYQRWIKKPKEERIIKVKNRLTI
jgi:hypothetical protein